MEDLQSLLEKINREGVEKAESEARKIIAEAQEKAAALVKAAAAEAAEAKAGAERSAADSAARAEESIRQAARDVVLGVKDGVTALLEQLLVQKVDRALADEATSAGLVTEAIKGMTGPGEITCGEKLAKALAACLSKAGAFTVTIDASLGTGFTVKLDGGRVEHAFTGEVIAAELAKRLRPELAKLLK